jgi:hypothetical protein
MKKDHPSRREILGQSAALGALAVLGTPGCSKPAPQLSCSDVSGLTPADVQIRTALAYVEVSMENGKSCSTCLQFLPAGPAVCGACKVVKGPINPRGYCKSFAPKPV